VEILLQGPLGDVLVVPAGSGGEDGEGEGEVADEDEGATTS
jgi:hypothetical protein